MQKLESWPKFSDSSFDAGLNGPRAFPPTGGSRISESALRGLRQSCIDAVDESSASSALSMTASFDIAIGRVLYRAGEHSIGEFGDPYVWDFLTLILMPDLAARRLAMGSLSTARGHALQKRITGGDRRHVFQRIWKRWLIFGPEIVEAGKLTEDDFGVTIERLITNRPRLARAVANAIVGSGYSGSERRDYSRIFMRRLQQTSGLVQIPDHDEDYLRDVIDALHRQVVETLK
ncbi:hypothetical protein [Brevibacterium atlanticum]|uniref:hypothetical protein n=1 Tax=Brevibacterium atlanticum TaxID=2697563 RepID=UPI00141FC065|nr:hypothetical protein [Brevibacterium atlanticum]